LQNQSAIALNFLMDSIVATNRNFCIITAHHWI
jgi:hypothetical protein